MHRNAVEKYIKKVVEKYGPVFQFYLTFPNSGARVLNIGAKSNPKSVLSNKYLNKIELMKQAVRYFDLTYKYNPTHGAFSPGVTNLIGDHSDYNHGFTVSMVIKSGFCKFNYF